MFYKWNVWDPVAQPKFSSMVETPQEQGLAEHCWKAEEDKSKFKDEQYSKADEIVCSILAGICTTNTDVQLAPPLSKYVKFILPWCTVWYRNDLWALDVIVVHHVKWKQITNCALLSCRDSVIGWRLNRIFCPQDSDSGWNQRTCSINLNSSLFDELCSKSFFLLNKKVMTYQSN